MFLANSKKAAVIVIIFIAIVSLYISFFRSGSNPQEESTPNRILKQKLVEKLNKIRELDTLLQEKQIRLFELQQNIAEGVHSVDILTEDLNLKQLNEYIARLMTEIEYIDSQIHTYEQQNFESPQHPSSTSASTTTVPTQSDSNVKKKEEMIVSNL